MMNKNASSTNLSKLLKNLVILILSALELHALISKIRPRTAQRNIPPGTALRRSGHFYFFDFGRSPRSGNDNNAGRKRERPAVKKGPLSHSDIVSRAPMIT